MIFIFIDSVLGVEIEGVFGMVWILGSLRKFLEVVLGCILL